MIVHVVIECLLTENWKQSVFLGFKTRVYKFGSKTDSENPKTEKLNIWISELCWQAQYPTFLIYCFLSNFCAKQEFWLCFDLGKKYQLWAQLVIKKSKYFVPSFRTQCIFSCCCSPLCPHFDLLEMESPKNGKNLKCI